MRYLLMFFALCAVTHTQNSYCMRSSRVGDASTVSSSRLANDLDSSNSSDSYTATANYAFAYGKRLRLSEDVINNRPPLHQAFYNQDEASFQEALRAGSYDEDKNAWDEKGLTLKDYVFKDDKIREYQEAASLGFVRAPDEIAAISILEISEAHHAQASRYLRIVNMILKMYGIKPPFTGSLNQEMQRRFVIAKPASKECCAIL